MSFWEAFFTILGMTLVTIVTRGFFLFPKQELPMPTWLKQGLRYAPLAAMAAIVVPEVVMSQGELIHTWKDARLYAAAAATVYFFWRRDILGTILSGTAVMLVLRLALGW
jgi:branched-subunit amino acid transport protein